LPKRRRYVVERELLTRREWDRKMKEVLVDLFQDYPFEPPDWRVKTAHRHMRRYYGPRPPGRVGLIVRALVRYLRASEEEKMDFSWTKNVWKGIKGALLVGVGVFLLSVLGALDTEGEALALGFPKFVAPIIVLLVGAAIPMVRNYFKVKKGVGRD
jgi:hypothetical protein